MPNSTSPTPLPPHPATACERLASQIAFIIEIDKLKNIVRRSYLMNGERRENSSEHSWHLAMMAVTLAEHAAEPVDVDRVVRMALAHDLVEIDAGDTFLYDEKGNADKHVRECEAADRVFGLLPDDQAVELRALWDEFEADETPEARFARSIDRLMPLLHNYHNQGKPWQEHGITSDRVLAACANIERGSPTLWAYARRVIEDAVAKGYLPPPPEDGADHPP